MFTPEDLCKSGTEDGHQAALFSWANMARIYGYEAASDALCYTEKGYAKSRYHKAEGITEMEMLFAVPNGGKRDKRTAARLRATGVKAGYPDVALDVSRGNHNGLRIELKRPKSPGKRKGATSPEQEAWLDKLNAYGYAAVICVGWEQARKVIIEYLAG